MLKCELKTIDKPREAIINIIAFFDLFDSPLTVYEIWENLSKQLELENIYDVLRKEIRGSEINDASSQNERPTIIQQKNGFYFLAGREKIIAVRQQRYNYFYRKIKIARAFSYLFKLCPFVQLVALANVIGTYNLRDGSDIDFFIITTSGRIWLSRLYCTGLAKILNRRPNIRTKRDKICLSFYLSQEHLNLQDLHLSGGDPYFYYWYHKLILLYNKNRVYEQFLQANKRPVSSESRNSSITESNINFFERQAKRIQLKIMPFPLKQAMNNSVGVVVNDQVLKFYRRDRRQEYAEKYENQIKKIFTADN